ncbi:unnamed protein product [Amoebophrya sp. A25]|nr:unnamed protein product [Amoebophrya sp. A25]|eukprot:GSA25T00004558001.1
MYVMNGSQAKTGHKGNEVRPFSDSFYAQCCLDNTEQVKEEIKKAQKVEQEKKEAEAKQKQKEQEEAAKAEAEAKAKAKAKEDEGCCC